MKKVFISLTLLAALAACKKDYTCECTTGTQTEKYVIKNVTKARAKANCVSVSTSKTSGGITTETNCSLK